MQYAFDVEAGAVRRFREASRDHSAVSPGDIVPLTFLGAAPSLSGRPHSLAAMGFDVGRAFHGSETVAMVAPVRIGDRLTVTESVRALSPVQGRRAGQMQRAERVEEFADDTGRVVARTRRIILEAEHVLAAPHRAETEPVPVDDGLMPPMDPLDSVSGGAPARFGPLSLADFVRYAAASADLTAIHYDEEAARRRGYRGPFAMGMLSAAYLGHLLESTYEPVPPWTLTVRFVDLLWPGETLLLSAGEVGSQGLVQATCSANGRTVTTARLELVQH